MPLCALEAASRVNEQITVEMLVKAAKLCTLTSRWTTPGRLRSWRKTSNVMNLPSCAGLRRAIQQVAWSRILASTT